MAADLGALVRHAAETVKQSHGNSVEYWARQARAVQSNKYDVTAREVLHAWIREKVEGWLLESGWRHRVVDGEFLWWKPNTSGYEWATKVRNESREIAALLAIKEATK